MIKKSNRKEGSLMGQPASNKQAADVVISITEAVPAKNQLPVACVKFRKDKIQALKTLSIGFAIQEDKILFTKTDRNAGGLAIDMRSGMAQTGRTDIIQMLRHFQGSYSMDISQPGRCFIQVDPDSVKALLQERGPWGIPGTELPPAVKHVEKHVEPVEPEMPKVKPQPGSGPAAEPIIGPPAETPADRPVTDGPCPCPAAQNTDASADILLLRLLAARLMKQIHPGNTAARETAAVLLRMLNDIETKGC